MIIIEQPHNHKEASWSATIIEEVSQSWSEGSGSVFERRVVHFTASWFFCFFSVQCIYADRAVYFSVSWFHTWIPHEKIADLYLFLVRVISLTGVIPLWNNQNGILSARYLDLSWSLWTWSADKEWWIDYLINSWTNSVNVFRSYGPLKIWAF